MTADEILSMTVRELLEMDSRVLRLLEELWITDLGHDTPCWIWTGGISREYGDIRTGTPRDVHRVSFMLFKGQLLEGHNIHHMCNNKRCFNPDHLTQLSLKDHAQADYHLREEGRQKAKEFFDKMFPEPEFKSTPGFKRRI